MYKYHRNQPHVGKYTIHGSYGIFNHVLFDYMDKQKIYCNTIVGFYLPTANRDFERIFWGSFH